MAAEISLPISEDSAQQSTRSHITGRACQRGRQRAAPLIPLCHCPDRAARIVSFWRHNPEISDILCGVNNTGVAVRDRDG